MTIASIRNKMFYGIVAVGFYVFLQIVLSQTVFAATVTWDNDSGDNNWNTAANWSGDAIPMDGDDLVFPATVDSDAISGDDRQTNNDIAGLTVASISVSGVYDNAGGDYDTYSISGNDLTITGDISGNSEGRGYPLISFIGVELTATAPVTLLAVSSDGGLTFGANNMTLQDAYFEGGATGSGDVALEVPPTPGGSGGGGGCGDGTAPPSSPFGGDSSGFSGAITVDNYLSVTSRVNDFARNASSIMVNSGSFWFGLDNGTDLSFNVPLTFNGGNLGSYQADDAGCEYAAYPTATISSDITATAEVAVFMSRTNFDLAGTVTGSENFVVEPGQNYAGTLTIYGEESTSEFDEEEISDDQSGSSRYLGANQGLVVSAGGTMGFVTVDGGILSGTGTVGDVSMSLGVIAPGLSPGCLSSGNLTYTGGTVEIEIEGTTVCTEYDQQDVTGTVDLGTATELDVQVLLSSFVPEVGDEFIIISNDGADAVVGEFADKADGSTFEVDGVTYRINYDGGDGNDVVLTVTAVDEDAVAAATPSAPDTGFGLITSPFGLVALLTALSAGVIALNARSLKNEN